MVSYIQYDKSSKTNECNLPNPITNMYKIKKSVPTEALGLNPLDTGGKYRNRLSFFTCSQSFRYASEDRYLNSVTVY